MDDIRLDINMRLKYQLRLYLEKRKLTASQLARIAKVPKQSVSDWMGGTIPRNLKHVKSIAEVLGVSLDVLLFGEEKAVDDTLFFDRPGDNFSNQEWQAGIFEVRYRRIKKGEI